MKPIYKYLIALAVGAILTASVVTCNREEPSVTTVTVTETDTIYKTVIKESPIKYVDRWHKPEPVIINVPDGTTIEPTDSTSVETTKYIGKEVLENGTIDYEIYADSLYATKFKLETKETIVTNNTTTTVTKVLPPKNKLFLTGGLEGAVFNNFVPQAANAGLMYNIKQKWGVGVEVRQDFSGLLPPQNATTIGVKVYIGL